MNQIYKDLTRVLLTLTFAVSSFLTVFSQGAAINTSGASADPSAILDVSSTNAGMLIPRMTKIQRNAINSPAEGLLIYQTDDTTGFWYQAGGLWKLMGSGAGSSIANGTAIGNTLYWDGSQWVESPNIFNIGGSVGVGTNSPDPSALFDMSSTTKGALIPRMTTAERNAILLPALALQIFNTTTNCFEFYTGTFWQSNVCVCTQAPPQPGIIIGQEFVCESESGVTYSVSPVPTTTSYAWSVPAGAIITAGQGTNTITVTFGSISGNVSVTAINTCGSSSLQSLPITITLLQVATFNYPDTPYCNNAQDPLPEFSGGGVAGTFSSTPGLIFVNTATGQVDLDASTPGTYIVTNTIDTVGGCPLISSTSSITIVEAPVIVCTSSVTENGPVSVTLDAIASAGVISWYDAPTGGNLLGTGASFTTPVLNATTTYYAEAVANACTTTTRSSATATITGNFPVDPTGTLKNGLLSYWKMDNSSNDLFGINDGVDFSMSYSSSAGKINQGAYFNGSGYITLPPDNADFTQGLSISLWAYPTANNTWARFIDFGNGQSSDNILFGREVTTNNLAFHTYNGNSSGPYVTAVNAILNNSWHQYAFTMNTSGNVILYRDGVQIATGSSLFPANVTRNFNYIGKSNWNVDGLYAGYMDEIGVWGRVLTPQEISSLYNGGNGQSTTLPAIAGNNAICIGATSQLSHTIPGGTWSSSNNSIATVDNNGLVSGISNGLTTITYSIADGNGCFNYSSISFTVNPTLNASVTIAAVPSGAICPGTSVTFTASPTHGGDSPVYQWYKGGSPISGATSSVYTTNTLVNNDDIMCVMTSNATPCLIGSPASSNIINIQVNPNLPASITISANPGSTVCAGTSVTFTSLVINGGTAPTYQWYKGGSAISGEIGSTYTTSSLTNNDVITCVLVSNAFPCLIGSPATSNSITMVVNAFPTITAVMNASRLSPGTLTIGATPSAGTVNWYDAQTGGNMLGSGTTYTTTVLNVTTTYYAEAVIGGCISVSRTAVVATIGVKAFQVDNGGTLTNGLVAYLPMEGNADDFYGSYTGVGTSMSYSSGAGKVGQGGNFNGSSSYITLPSGFADFTGGMTISFWAYPISNPLWARFIDFGNGSASNNILFARNSTTSNLTLEVYVGGSNGGTVTYSNGITNNAWNHYLATVSSSGFTTIYKNGIPVVTGNTGVPVNTIRTSNYIGRSNWPDALYYGYMDEMGIWNRVLSTQEINNLYNAGNGQTMQ